MRHVIALALVLAAGLCVLAIIRETGRDAADDRVDDMVDDYIGSQP